LERWCKRGSSGENIRDNGCQEQQSAEAVPHAESVRRAGDMTSGSSNLALATRSCGRKNWAAKGGRQKGTFYFFGPFRGRPRGRKVDSRPSLVAASFVQ
jgi:hypothetical protein